LYEKKYVDLKSISVRCTSIVISLLATIYLINIPLIVAVASRELELTSSEPLWLGGVFLGGTVLAGILTTLYISLVNWRLLSFVSSIMGVISFLLPTFLSDFSFLLICQGLSGFFTGTVCSVAFVCLGTSANPIRSYALVLCLQSIIVALTAYCLPPKVAGLISFNNVLIAASCICAGLVILSLKVSKNIKQVKLIIPVPHKKKLLIIFFLVALLLIFVGGNTVRNTIEPIAYSAGFYMVILALSSSIGGLLAALMEIRSSYVKPIVSAMGVSVLLLVVGLSGYLPQKLIVIAFCFIGGAWNFSAAFLMGLFSELNYRYIPLIITVQVIGNIVSLVVVGSLYAGQPYIIACVVWILTALIVFLLARSDHKLFLVKKNE
tara:strand:+ start:631 stop:1764 length:1134 start_codon:yes stop_codon:yes gene_type:complete